MSTRRETRQVWLKRFSAYSPEMGRAIRRMDQEFVAALSKETEPISEAHEVCAAFTVFWGLYHGGQSSRLYSLGSRFEHTFQFRPAHGLDEKTLNENEKQLYQYLKNEFGFKETEEEKGLATDEK